MNPAQELLYILQESPDGTPITSLAQRIGVNPADNKEMRLVTSTIRLAGYSVAKKTIWVSATESQPAHPKHFSVLRK